MEDFVTDTEKDAALNQVTGEVQEQEPKKRDENIGEEESSGIVQMISNLVSPKPDNSDGIMNNLSQETGEEQESSGIIQKISDLVSPKPDNNPFSSGGASDGGGGIMNKMSNIFSNNHQDEDQEQGSEKVSVVDTIVSRLPTPLADDVAPESEEASILIHSIIHD